MRSIILKITALFLLLISFNIMITSITFAQDTKKVIEEEKIPIGYELALKINFAKRLMNENRYNDAAIYLEKLFQIFPDSPIITDLLKRCYTNLEEYYKLENILAKQTENDPKNFILSLNLSETIAKQGRIDDAVSAFIKTSELIDSNDINIMRIFIQSMLRHSMENQAAEIIRNWRDKTSNDRLLSIEMGTIAERQKDYLTAVEEYYQSLKDPSFKIIQAEKKLNLLLDFTDSSPVVENYILERSDLFQNQNAVDILLTYYLRSGKYEKAFEFSIIKDSIDNYSGTQLISFIISSSSRKLYDQTIRMGEFILSRHNYNFADMQFYFLYAEALKENNQLREAMEIYDKIFDNSGYKSDKASSLFNIGKIYLENYRNFELGLKYFDSVLIQFPKTIYHKSSSVLIPFCYLGIGDLDNMESSIFDALSNGLVKDEDEKMKYYLALNYLFKRNIESCRNILNNLVIENLDGLFVNDALKLIRILDETENHTNIIDYYSSFIYYQERNLIDSSFISLNKIISDTSGILADLALYELALQNRKNSDIQKSLDNTELFLDRYSDSYYTPFVIKLKADILFENEKQKDKATELYKEIIDLYPDYPFIMEIREKLNSVAQKRPA